ncbi:hypothetical protein Plec18167_006575 [Paecilomyces lecythidis]|uniref:Ferric reductase NAD binding domain-containing protein n=1 Tax=Paecilomyces lecythidis TaxID=3004212 RepID=A0ABR3XBC4_9EURO
MAAFDDVVFFAGGSGITAIASQLLDLIKKMRDGKAVTKSVRIIWSMKNTEIMEWFKEELRICREFAPPNSVHCQFFLTGDQQNVPTFGTHFQAHNDILNYTVNEALQETWDKRNSALIREEAAGDPEREKELRRENEDAITSLPHAYIPQAAGPANYYQPQYSYGDQRLAAQSPYYYTDPRLSVQSYHSYGDPRSSTQSMYSHNNSFNFGFPSPTSSLTAMPRFAFLPTQKKDGWRTEYGRPDITSMLKDMSKSFGRRTCIFVCGPPSMRVEVARTVAGLQRLVMTDASKDEIFLHAENYAL